MAVNARHIRGNLVYVDSNRKRLLDAYGPDVVKYIEDFVDPVGFASDALAGWTVTLVEAGAGESTVARSDAAAGRLLITTDANEDDGITMQVAHEAWEFSADQYATYFGIRFQASEATQIDWLAGLCITDTTPLGGMTDGVYFEKLDGGTGISFVTEKDSTETQSDSLATFAAATDTLLEFFFDGAEATVEAFINGAAVAKHSTNIPDDELLTPTIQVLAGSAAARTLSLDFIRVIQIGR